MPSYLRPLGVENSATLGETLCTGALDGPQLKTTVQAEESVTNSDTPPYFAANKFSASDSGYGFGVSELCLTPAVIGKAARCSVVKLCH